MRYDIEQKFGHYILYVNGQFAGSYDTFYEAVQDVEEMQREAEDGTAAS